MRISQLNTTNFSGLVRIKPPSVRAVREEHSGKYENMPVDNYRGLEEAILSMNETMNDSKRLDRDIYYFLEKDDEDYGENSGAYNMYISEIKDRKTPANLVHINPHTPKNEIIQKARYACTCLDRLYNTTDLEDLSKSFFKDFKNFKIAKNKDAHYAYDELFSRAVNADLAAICFKDELYNFLDKNYDVNVELDGSFQNDNLKVTLSGEYYGKKATADFDFINSKNGNSFIFKAFNKLEDVKDQKEK